jgi:hypothetical protein
VKRIPGPWRHVLILAALAGGFLVLRNVVLPFLGLPP